MIKHDCTPYCDGERYCVEPGTHTAVTWWLPNKTAEDFNHSQLLSLRSVFEVIRAVPAPDVKHQDSHATRVATPRDVAYLITMRDCVNDGEQATALRKAAEGVSKP